MTDAVSDLPASMVVECPGCRGPVATRSDMPFRAARCPLCGGEFLLPRPRGDDGAAPPPPATTDRPEGDFHETDSPSFSLPESPAASLVADTFESGPEAAAARPRGALEFEEPVKMIETAAGIKTLRRLSPQEKQARRARRNLIMLAGGATILFVLVYLLRGEPPRR